MNGVISDAMDAGRYLAHFANELGIDARRIVTSGHSAGGHLALMMALASPRRLCRGHAVSERISGSV